MSTATVTPITKNLSSDEAIERGYRLLIASLDSQEFHRFVSHQFDTGSDGPEAENRRPIFVTRGSDVKRVHMCPQGRSRRCFLLST